MKPCCKCKKEKKLDCFYKHRKTNDGRQTQCIECDKARKRQPEERLRDRKYHQKHKEHRNSYFREYRQKNRDAIRKRRAEYLRNYRIENAERIKKYMDAYYESPQGKIKRKIRKANRRAVESSASDGTLTKRNLQLLLELQDGKCAMCTKTLFREKNDTHLDHICPIKHGGKNSIYNTQWLCAPCNLKKGHQLYYLFPNHVSTYDMIFV